MQPQQREKEITNHSNTSFSSENGEVDDRNREEIRQGRWPKRIGPDTEKAKGMCQGNQSVSEGAEKIVVNFENKENTKKSRIHQTEKGINREGPSSDKTKDKKSRYDGEMGPRIT